MAPRPLTFKTRPSLPIKIAQALLFLSVFIGAQACESPPAAPEPSVDIDKKVTDLKENIEETRKKAADQMEKAADAGGFAPDTSSNAQD